MIRFISHDTIEELASEFGPGETIRVAPEVSTATAANTGITKRTYRINAQAIDARGDVHYVRVFTGQVQHFAARSSRIEHDAMQRAVKDTDDVQAALTTWLKRAGYDVRGGQIATPTNLALVDSRGASFIECDDFGRPCINEPALHSAIALLPAA